MSTLAKATLATSILVSGSIIYYVHHSQFAERARMRQGVVIDMARQERKRQNVEQLRLQSELTKILEKEREEQEKKEQQMQSQEMKKS